MAARQQTSEGNFEIDVQHYAQPKEPELTLAKLPVHSSDTTAHCAEYQ
ncbi:MAG: hypothetical protein ACRBB4_03920 [Neptuniibacter sp.]